MASDFQKRAKQLENVLRVTRECRAHIEQSSWFGPIDSTSATELIAAFVAMTIDDLASASGPYYGWMSFYSCCQALRHPLARFVPLLDQLDTGWRYGLVVGIDGNTLASLTVTWVKGV